MADELQAIPQNVEQESFWTRWLMPIVIWPVVISDVCAVLIT